MSRAVPSTPTASDDHREAARRVVGAVAEGERPEVRHLPEEQDAEEDHRAGVAEAAPPPATHPITGGMAPGTAPGTAAKGEVGLSQGV